MLDDLLPEDSRSSLVAPHDPDADVLVLRQRGDEPCLLCNVNTPYLTASSGRPLCPRCARVHKMFQLSGIYGKFGQSPVSGG